MTEILMIKRRGVFYTDLSIPFDRARVPAANDPTWSAFVGNLNAFVFQLNDYLEFSSELLHGYQEGSDLEMHIHWVTNGTDIDNRAVKWEIEYSFANRDAAGFGDVFPATTVVSAEQVIPADTPNLSHAFKAITTVTGTGFEIGRALKGRVRRIAAAGTDPSSDPFGLAIGIHYRVDTLGSRLITQK